MAVLVVCWARRTGLVAAVVVAAAAVSADRILDVVVSG